MSTTIAIIDAGIGNIRSVYKALQILGAQPVVANTPSQVLHTDKIILPGVGHFGKAINNLKVLNFYDILNEAVLVKKIPILGICLGMQLMANESEEGNTTGFAWINKPVTKFKIQNRIKYKVPHTGWNSINTCYESNLLKKVPNHSEFYFLHSYHYEVKGSESILAKTTHEIEFVSIIEKENIFGTQFHPEKSHEAGRQLLKNFINN